MSSFSDLNGVPCSGNEFLMKQVLRQEWGFDGFVVSDWDAIKELTVHGFTADDQHAVQEAIDAGIDMEMASTLYSQHLPALLEAGTIRQQQIDAMVCSIIKLKFQLGLFDNPYTDPGHYPRLVNAQHLQAAKEAALRSCVLLKNDQRKQFPKDKFLFHLAT